MIWIAPSEKDAADGMPKQRFLTAADQRRANSVFEQKIHCRLNGAELSGSSAIGEI